MPSMIEVSQPVAAPGIGQPIKQVVTTQGPLSITTEKANYFGIEVCEVYENDPFSTFKH